MKSPVKALLIASAVLIALPIVAWTGTFLYWHLRITSDLRAWKKAAADRVSTAGYRDGGIPRETAMTLHLAGCRSLPYLATSLEDSTDPMFQEGVMRQIIQALNPPGPPAEATFEAMSERNARWQFIAEGLNLEREQKIADFREWWRANSPEYHQVWRVWSSNCRGAR